jgi:hypothetical protein
VPGGCGGCGCAADFAAVTAVVVTFVVVTVTFVVVTVVVVVVIVDATLPCLQARWSTAVQSSRAPCSMASTPARVTEHDLERASLTKTLLDEKFEQVCVCACVSVSVPECDCERERVRL